MIFKLAEAAEKGWRRLDGHHQLPKVIVPAAKLVAAARFSLPRRSCL
jgi:hypothetical protein